MQGYFDNNIKEYIITDMKPRRPLINFLWSEDMISRLDHFGFGYSMAGIGSVRRRLVDGERHVYIKRGNELYSANRNFAGLAFDEHKTHVGLGYQRIISQYKGLKSEMTICIPEAGYVELTNVKFVNTSGADIAFDTYVYLKPVINTTCHTAYSRCGWDTELRGLLYTHDGYCKDDFGFPHTYNTVFVKADRAVKAWAVSDTEFIGYYGTTTNPVGMIKERLTNVGATFEDAYCATMQFEICLKPGEETSINVTVGIGETSKEAAGVVENYCSQKSYLNTLKRQAEINSTYSEVFTVKTPDDYFNSMVNIWLKRQVSLGKTWGRVYGKGFRDVMQDVTGFVSMDTVLAKNRILYALKHQFINGNTLRMYDPIFNAPYTDGAAWIPATLLAYINESGDLNILQEKVGYYNDKAVESVFEHLKRGVSFLTANLGKHGLCLWGGGDWNDSLNACGLKGIGESVWLSIATVKAVKEYAEIAELVGLQAKELMGRAEALTKSIMKYGFEKDRFIYGYNDNGDKIGSAESEQAKIFLNPQTWAVLAGIADGELAERLMSTVEKHLKTKFGYKQCFPAYTRGTLEIGRASYFVEGLVENGSVYNHGVMFKLVSDCILGKGDEAYKTFLMIRYDNPNNPHSGVEPYAVSNMFIGDDCPYENQIGYAPMSWISGSAGWLYRGLTEFILGVKSCFIGLKIQPVLPSGWDNIHISRKFRNAKYDITIKRGESKLLVDGKEIKGDTVLYDGKNHTVVCFTK